MKHKHAHPNSQREKGHFVVRCMMVSPLSLIREPDTIHQGQTFRGKTERWPVIASSQNYLRMHCQTFQHVFNTKVMCNNEAILFSYCSSHTPSILVRAQLKHHIKCNVQGGQSRKVPEESGLETKQSSIPRPWKKNRSQEHTYLLNANTHWLTFASEHLTNWIRK